MSEERMIELLKEIRDDAKETLSYLRENKRGMLGQLTYTPARAMVTTLVLIGVFLVISALIATQNQEALMQVLDMFGGG